MCLHHIKKNFPRLIIALVILATIAGGIWWYGSRQSTSEENIPGFYRSGRLGIEFYYPVDCGVEEQGNKVTLTAGGCAQSIEIFFKDPRNDLKTAIEERFLSTASAKERCTVVVDEGSSGKRITAEITYDLEGPVNPKLNPEGGWWIVRPDECPEEYSLTPYAHYFLMDPEHSDRFAHLVIGHAWLESGREGSIENQESWVDTLEFFDVK